jgi:hypothetical protein
MCSTASQAIDSGLSQGERPGANLRVAFSVTVAGLMIGAFAFAISLVRDRLYAQDYSDVEYVAASLTAPSADGAPLPHSHLAVAP